MGFFIALEGPEGSGKSTQARLLGERLSDAGYSVVVTREPGSTAIGEQLRSIILDAASYAMLPATEALLYSAARAQHVGEVLRPALAAGRIVVCDRYIESTLAYQGGGRGLPLDDLLTVQRLATDGLVPDLYVLFDLPVAVGLARRFAAGEDVNRLDTADIEFHERVRRAYLQAVRRDPQRWVVIDAAQPIADVTAQLTEAVVAALQSKLGVDVDLERSMIEATS